MHFYFCKYMYCCCNWHSAVSIVPAIAGALTLLTSPDSLLLLASLFCLRSLYCLRPCFIMRLAINAVFPAAISVTMATAANAHEPWTRRSCSCMHSLQSLQSLQCLISSWSKNFKLRTLTKYQSLNSFLTVNKCFLQLLLFGFTFLDLLIKFMKMDCCTSCTAPPHPCNVTARAILYLHHST